MAPSVVEGELSMCWAWGAVKGMLARSIERDRSWERYLEAASRHLWPWRESRLLAIVGCLAVLDYLSTYVALGLSGKAHFYEGGMLASWALHTGGFGRLLLIDIAAVSALLLAAIAIRFLYIRFGFKGFGRTAFVIALLPYMVITMAAVYNNIALTFL